VEKEVGELLTSELGTVGAEIETPKALRGRGLGKGCPPPQPTRGSGVAS